VAACDVFVRADGETLDTMAQTPSEKSIVGDSNQRMPKNLPPSIKDAHFLLQVHLASYAMSCVVCVCCF
jgi:hypothetical protein